MHYVVMIVVGLIVGILARFFYPGAVHMSLIASAVLGILGSFLAGARRARASSGVARSAISSRRLYLLHHWRDDPDFPRSERPSSRVTA